MAPDGTADVLAGTIVTDFAPRRAAATPPARMGSSFLPYLAVDRSPLWDPEARGVLRGPCTSATARPHRRAIVYSLSSSPSSTSIRLCSRRGSGHHRACLRRPGASRFWNGVMGRYRFPDSSSRKSSRPRLARRSWPRFGIDAHPYLPTAIGRDPHRERIEPRGDLAPVLDRYSMHTCLCTQATAPILRHSVNRSATADPHWRQSGSRTYRSRSRTRERRPLPFLDGHRPRHPGRRHHSPSSVPTTWQVNVSCASSPACSPRAPAGLSSMESPSQFPTRAIGLVVQSRDSSWRSAADNIA